MYQMLFYAIEQGVEFLSDDKNFAGKGLLKFDQKFRNGIANYSEELVICFL